MIVSQSRHVVNFRFSDYLAIKSVGVGRLLPVKFGQLYLFQDMVNFLLSICIFWVEEIRVPVDMAAWARASGPYLANISRFQKWGIIKGSQLMTFLGVKRRIFICQLWWKMTWIQCIHLLDFIWPWLIFIRSVHRYIVIASVNIPLLLISYAWLPESRLVHVSLPLKESRTDTA